MRQDIATQEADLQPGVFNVTIANIFSKKNSYQYLCTDRT